MSNIIIQRINVMRFLSAIRCRHAKLIRKGAPWMLVDQYGAPSIMKVGDSVMTLDGRIGTAVLVERASVRVQFGHYVEGISRRLLEITGASAVL
jgi:hypothetical protein